MSPADAQGADPRERLLAFELAGAIYALPLSSVIEVAEAGALACIPTLPPSVGGVVNFHGDALPVVQCSAVLETGAHRSEPRHVLVLADRSPGAGEATSAPVLGLPVDRVLGLVEGRPAVARAADPVAERRTIGGRVANLIDPGRLLSRAREVIEQSVGRITPH